MDAEQQRWFEADLLKQQALERANSTVADLRQLISDDVTSEDLLAQIPADCLVEVEDQTGFSSPEWLPEDAAKDAYRKWQLMSLLRRIEFRRLTGEVDDKILEELHGQLSRIGLLDRLRLDAGLFEAINPFNNEEL